MPNRSPMTNNRCFPEKYLPYHSLPRKARFQIPRGLTSSMGRSNSAPTAAANATADGSVYQGGVVDMVEGGVGGGDFGSSGDERGVTASERSTRAVRPLTSVSRTGR